jgi:hypothetical protein
MPALKAWKNLHRDRMVGKATRRFGPFLVMSAFPPIATVARTSQQVRVVQEQKAIFAKILVGATVP